MSRSADHTVESLATILEPAILPAVKYVRLFQKLQSQPVVVRAAGHKVVSHWSHPHKLFRNTEGTLHSCDVCGARVRMCHTCHHGCDFDGVCGCRASHHRRALIIVVHSCAHMVVTVVNVARVPLGRRG